VHSFTIKHRDHSSSTTWWFKVDPFLQTKNPAKHALQRKQKLQAPRWQWIPPTLSVSVLLGLFMIYLDANFWSFFSRGSCVHFSLVINVHMISAGLALRQIIRKIHYWSPLKPGFQTKLCMQFIVSWSEPSVGWEPPKWLWQHLLNLFSHPPIALEQVSRL